MHYCVKYVIEIHRNNLEIIWKNPVAIAIIQDNSVEFFFYFLLSVEI